MKLDLDKPYMISPQLNQRGLRMDLADCREQCDCFCFSVVVPGVLFFCFVFPGFFFCFLPVEQLCPPHLPTHTPGAVHASGIGEGGFGEGR